MDDKLAHEQNACFLILRTLAGITIDFIEGLLIASESIIVMQSGRTTSCIFQSVFNSFNIRSFLAASN